MDVDIAAEENTWNFKCDLCDEKTKDHKDFMMHKKKKHSDTIVPCEKFLRGECTRADDWCWFKHSSKVNDNNTMATLESPLKKQVFHKVHQNSIPPDQSPTMIQLLKTLCMKMEKMDQKFQDLLE